MVMVRGSHPAFCQTGWSVEDYLTTLVQLNALVIDEWYGNQIQWLKRILVDMLMSSFNTLCRHFSAATEGNHQNLSQVNWVPFEIRNQRWWEMLPLNSKFSLQRISPPSLYFLLRHFLRIAANIHYKISHSSTCGLWIRHSWYNRW
jgi:hypothetical protein